MKKILRFAFVAVLAAFAFVACAPQGFDEYELGDIGSISADQVNFSYTTSPQSDNILIFTNISDIKIPYAYTWDLGNGTVSNDKTPTGIYPDAGTYTVSLSVFSANGSTVVKTQNITIAKDDASLLDTPVYRNLTGGTDAADGKVWVFDQYNLYVKEVADATKRTVQGHFGMGDPYGGQQNWWGAGPNEKADWKLYDFKFQFIQNGLKLNITTDGFGYGKSETFGIGGFTAIDDLGSGDASFAYTGGNFNFSLNDAGELPVLTLSAGAAMGYYIGVQSFNIIYLTDEVMALHAYSAALNQDWVFVFIREDLNVSEPPIVKTLQEVPLFEDFEGESTIEWNWLTDGDDGMGAFTSRSYQNPAPVPINQSSKVFLYEKSTHFYSNINFTTTDYLFDLTSQNKIRMKVFIPSYNDYATDGDVAGDWISNRKLQPKVAVKLQDSTRGGNAWETETVVVHDNLTLDTWLELEFDFSHVATRQDYDKIVVQFGDEGHTRSGIFFFDDFSFDK
jgi:PKD repeat protein